MLKEVRFRLEHENCWLQESTVRHPDVTLVASSVYMVEDEIHLNLTVHASDRGTVAALRDEWSADGRIRKVSRLYEGPRGTRFHVSYANPDSLFPYILHHTPVSMGNVSVSAGQEHYTLVGEAEDVHELVRELQKEATVEVVSMRNLEEVPEDGRPEGEGRITDRLTDKQLEALVLAHAEGYYRWPRTLSASELATRLGLSSSAFLDHLRHAEAKELDAVVERLKAEDPARYQGVRNRLRQGAAARRKPAKA